MANATAPKAAITLAKTPPLVTSTLVVHRSIAAVFDFLVASGRWHACSVFSLATATLGDGKKPAPDKLAAPLRAQWRLAISLASRQIVAEARLSNGGKLTLTTLLEACTRDVTRIERTLRYVGPSPLDRLMARRFQDKEARKDFHAVLLAAREALVDQ